MISRPKILILVGIVLISCIILTQALPVSPWQQQPRSGIPEAESNTGQDSAITTGIIAGSAEDGSPGDKDATADEPFDILQFLKKYFGKQDIITEENLAENCTENATFKALPTDDEIFRSILRNESFSLNLLSLQCIIALDQGDQNSLRSNAARLHHLAVSLHEQVEPLAVEPHHFGRKALFLESMETFIEVTSTLKEGQPGFVSERRAAYVSLTSAIETLDNVIRNQNCQLPGTADTLASAAVIQEVVRPDDIRPVGMPAVYRDATNSNEVSIYPRYARIIQTLFYEEQLGLGFATRHMNAPEGTSYMMVHIIATHRGNLDGKQYLIQTPPASAFTLHGPEGSYRPLTTPGYTSIGEMYTQKTLNRRESSESSLLFEVPADLTLSNAYLSVRLGSTHGTASWNLI